MTAVFFSVIGAVFLTCSTGIGALLHWLLPAVDFGIAILIGMLTLVFTGHCFLKFKDFLLESYDGLVEDHDEIEDVADSRDFRLAVIHEPRRHRRRRARR